MCVGRRLRSEKKKAKMRNEEGHRRLLVRRASSSDGMRVNNAESSQHNSSKHRCKSTVVFTLMNEVVK